MLPHGHNLASPRDSGLDKCYIEASCYLQRHQKIAGHWLRRAAIWLRRLRFEVAFMRSQSSFLPWRCLRSLIREGRANVVVAGRSFLDAQPVPCRTMEEATTSQKDSSFCSSRGACSSSSSCRVASVVFTATDALTLWSNPSHSLNNSSVVLPKRTTATLMCEHPALYMHHNLQ
jgi:hypothetical protein